MQQNESSFQKNILILTEQGLKGTENQCVALAERIGSYAQHFFKLNFPHNIISPYVALGIQHSIRPPITSPLPDILIAGGRKAIAPALWIKKQKPGCFVAYIQDPKTYREKFDLIVTPKHDQYSADNVIETIGCINKITPKVCGDAKEKFPLSIPQGKTPIAVLIGGDSKTHRMDNKSVDEIIETLHSLQENHNAYLMLTFSRRTSSSAQEQIRKNVYCGEIWNDLGENPLLSYLGHAEYVFVTNDSVSMISEAASCGKPVYMIPLSGGSNKFDRFYDSMITGKYARYFDKKLENWGSSPLLEADRVAKLFIERYENYVTN